jgi:ABC-type transport system involved in Fe-S cluster assembly fused permease/ATPase subunit
MVGVMSALDAMLRGVGRSRTVLTIAHRLSTIDGADVVVVLRDGAIVADERAVIA